METTWRDIAFMVVAGVAIFGSVLGYGIHTYFAQYRRADAMLADWSKRAGYELVDKEEANPPNTGPKARYGSTKQVWYRVVVVDETGQRKTALVKLGSKTFGTLDKEVSVEWLP